MLYRLARRVLRPLFAWYFRWECQDLHHLPPAGPAILAANHVNYLDPLLIGAAVPRQIHFMAKHELFHNRALAWLLDRVGAFPVRRGQADRQAIRRALELLAAGKVVGIFPEGTRSETGELQDVQGGTALLALKSGAPVVPLAVLGVERALDAGNRRWPRRSRVTLKMGPPLTFTRVERVDRGALAAASLAIHDAIAALLPEDARRETGRAAMGAGPGDNRPVPRKRYAPGGKEV
ncbi:MAG TPA: lysophospholipid acyltransferase family protein [Limnochordales bacterium]|nr:lysophospholipid acyltransferase family protein [Limnochordales bacterium]